MFRPDLRECVLEERALLAIANQGIEIFTTSGLSLITPFPGANSSGAGSSGPPSGSAAPVSGVPVPTSLYMTGTGGISSLRPGNISGVPSLAGGATIAGGSSLTIQVGSGADTADGPTLSISNGGATNNLVGRSTVADPTGRTTITTIGGTLSSTDSAVLPPGQSYRDTAPVAPSPAMGVVNQSATGAGTMNRGGSAAPNPQLGAPTLGPFNRARGLAGPAPGTLVPVSPFMPGNN